MGDRISAVGPDLQRGGRIHGQFIDVGSKLMLVLEDVIVGDDAAGVRREAGRHAEKINILINELLSGHPISDQALREVIGHTPMEVLGGVCLGIAVGLAYWYYIG